ncbi:MAG: hypothetical protein D6814_05965 [Calditrichaeota bacterium]|nr:MAG: hypothetical protein D6814_05965 [Calditrichota bacterium]
MIKKPFVIFMFLLLGGVLLLACAQSEQMRNTGRSMPASKAALASQSARNVQSPLKHKAIDEKHPEVDFSISCYECHTEATPEITQQWHNSTHGKVNIKCFICHGDGEQEFSAKPTTDRCLACHSRQEVDFSKTEASSCFSCHNGHTLKFHEK